MCGDHHVDPGREGRRRAALEAALASAIDDAVKHAIGFTPTLANSSPEPLPDPGDSNVRSI